MNNNDLDELVSRIAIQDMLARYAHAIDRRDFAALDDIFLPDAYFDLSSGAGVAGTWPQIRPHLQHGLTSFVLDFHHFSSIAVTIGEELGTATSESKVINPRTRKDDDGGLHREVAFGVYYDRWRRTGQGWRIAERVWQRAWLWSDPTTSKSDDEPIR
ncbi:MAG TPA: nuclear transport factor 2 family protein [Streptosporangiaceae bacterium]